MATRQMPSTGQKQADVPVQLKQLKRDMQRLLRMQWKEFIHFVDDELARHCHDLSKKDHAA